MNDVIIGVGNLDGKGIYANRDFAQGEVVIQYNLRNISPQEYNKLPKIEKMFVHEHDGNLQLYLEPARYVNHSSNPNTYQDHDRHCDIALRDIKKGEMITCDNTKDDF
jgi:SET domain-containing protein